MQVHMLTVIARQADYVMKFCVTRGHNEQKKQRRQKNKGKMAKTRNQHVEIISQKIVFRPI